MNTYQLISDNFHRTIEAVSLSVDTIAPALEQASNVLTQALLNDNKAFCCGSGPGTAVCALLTHHCSHHFAQDRPALPLINLCADTAAITGSTTLNQPDTIFARPLRALGQSGDVLVVIAGHQDQPCLLQALQSAKAQDMHVVLMSGATHSELPAWLDANDVHLITAANNLARVIELQIMTVNCLSELIDSKLFGTHPSEQELLLP